MVILLLTGNCKAEDNRLNSIVLAVEDSWPPYSDSTGQGIATNIVKQAYAAVGIKVILKVLPYARVLKEVEKGFFVGGYNVTRQSTTEKNFLFGQQFLLSAPASFYFSPSNSKAINYKNIKDIPDDSSVGVIIDYEYGDLFDEHKERFKKVYVSNQSQIISMLTLGRIDTAIMFDEVANETLKSMGLNNKSIIKGPLNHTSDIYVAFSRTHKDAVFFKNKLDEGLLLIKSNGQYDEILSYRINILQ